MNKTNDTLTDAALLAWRTSAAEASGGTSSEAVVSRAFKAMLDEERTGEVLEYGAGTGVLLKRLLGEKWAGKLTGADLLPRPEGMPDSVEWIQADLNMPIDHAGASFDLVVSTEVIEHLENPRAVAREFARLLRPGGRLILTTPNQESMRSLLSLLVNGHFALFQDSCYPAHITALLAKDLLRIFTEAGFVNIRFEYVSHGGIPKCPHITWQQISFGILRGRLFSDNILMEASLPEIRG